MAGQPRWSCDHLRRVRRARMRSSGPSHARHRVPRTTRNRQVPVSHRRPRFVSYPRCSRNAALAGRSSEGVDGGRRCIRPRSGGRCPRRSRWIQTGPAFSPNADSPCSCQPDRHTIALDRVRQCRQRKWTRIKGYVNLASNLRTWHGAVAGRSFWETCRRYGRCPMRRNLGRTGTRASLWDATRGRLLVYSSNMLKIKQLNREPAVPSRTCRPPPIRNFARAAVAHAAQCGSCRAVPG